MRPDNKDVVKRLIARGALKCWGGEAAVANPRRGGRRNKSRGRTNLEQPSPRRYQSSPEAFLGPAGRGAPSLARPAAAPHALAPYPAALHRRARKPPGCHGHIPNLGMLGVGAVICHPSGRLGRRASPPVPRMGVFQAWETCYGEPDPGLVSSSAGLLKYRCTDVTPCVRGLDACPPCRGDGWGAAGQGSRGVGAGGP